MIERPVCLQAGVGAVNNMGPSVQGTQRASIAGRSGQPGAFLLLPYRILFSGRTGGAYLRLSVGHAAQLQLLSGELKCSNESLHAQLLR
jgi:hypothetical protein